MNILALVILFVVVFFLTIQIRGLVVFFLERKKNKQQDDNKSKIKGDKVDDRN